jgi:hypothetical protein
VAGDLDLALQPITRIVALAREMAGDEDRAALWFKHLPIPACGGKTAYDLVGEGRADVVLIYLEAIRSGAYV